MDISRPTAAALRARRDADETLSPVEIVAIYLSELRDETRFPEKVDFIANFFMVAVGSSDPGVDVTVTGTPEQREGEIEHAVDGLEEGDTITVTKKAKK